MMGVSHAYSGLAIGCAAASVGVPHRVTLFDVAASIAGAAGPNATIGAAALLGVAAVVFVTVFAVLLPGFLVPDALLANPPAPVLVLFVLIVGGCALMPDLDHPSSTVARTLGPITGVISNGLDRLSLTLYHATRLDRDPPERHGGHRLITHTWPGSAGFATIALICQLAHPYAAGVAVGISVGLLATGIRRTLRKVIRQLPSFLRWIGTVPGFTFGSTSGVAAWWCTTTYPGWSLLFPLAVFLGCAIHREGDWCTNSGVPRRLWGLPEDGGTRRWKKHKAPRTFDTGKDVELYTVRIALAGAVLVSTAGTLVGPLLAPSLFAAGGA